MNRLLQIYSKFTGFIKKTEKSAKDIMLSQANIWSGKVEVLVHMIFVHVNVNTPYVQSSKVKNAFLFVLKVNLELNFFWFWKPLLNSCKEQCYIYFFLELTLLEATVSVSNGGKYKHIF